MDRIRAGSRLGGCLHSLTVMHECTGLTLTLPARTGLPAALKEAVSSQRKGAAPGGFNSLEQEVTRDLVMRIHLGAVRAVCAAGPADGLPTFNGKAEGHGRFRLQNAQFSWKHADQEETH